MNVRRFLILIAAVVATVVSGCDEASQEATEMEAVSAQESYAAEADELADFEEEAPPQSPPEQEAPAGRADDDGGDPAPPEEAETPDRQLIYTAELVLAAYNITDKQERAIDYVEDIGGYVSNRSSDYLQLRVPAEQFRSVVDDLSGMADVVSLSWEAEDVTEKVRDVQIRLRNARQLRDRLEGLLDETETIEEALEIESELERVTLEIERLEGTLANLEDRIAYSTIDVHFDLETVEDDLPEEEFLLPIAWVDDLGIESLLEAPE